tara:strand:- start:4643 stop:5098 length:456 start_codon:yes stop_codon:yes gene_type:complete
MFLQINFKFLIIFFILCLISVVNAEEVFLSLKKNKVNVRYGPSFDSPIKYIYKKKDLPLKLLDRKENFRRVVDLKNNSGWIHVSQLKKVSSIIAKKDKILFKKPSNFSIPIAQIKKGRMLNIKKCQIDWCKVETTNFKGWIKTDNTWGLMN